jgi:hypothetical protein
MAGPVDLETLNPLITAGIAVNRAASRVLGPGRIRERPEKAGEQSAVCGCPGIGRFRDDRSMRRPGR